MDKFATVVALVALGMIALVIIMALLVQLGCYLTGAEWPSLGRAVLVVLASMLVGFFVNLSILLTTGVVVQLSGAQGFEKGGPWFWVMRGVQMVSDALVFAGVSTGLLKGVTFGRGVLIGLIVCAGAVMLGFAAAFAVGGMMALRR